MFSSHDKVNFVHRSACLIYNHLDLFGKDFHHRHDKVSQPSFSDLVKERSSGMHAKFWIDHVFQEKNFNGNISPQKAAFPGTIPSLVSSLRVLELERKR